MSKRLNTLWIFLALTAVALAITGAIPSTGNAAERKSGKELPPLTHLTPTPARTPTRTPTPTLRPTSQSSQVFNFDEVYFMSGFGAGGFCGTWEEMQGDIPANASLPYVHIKNTEYMTIVCSYGFDPYQDITVELYTPDGRRAAVYTVPPDEEKDEPDSREFSFKMHLSLPYGTWTLLVRDRHSSARGRFAHPQSEGASFDVTHVLSSDVLHPNDPRWRMDYKQGDQAGIYGVGLRPNSEITVVVGRPIDESSSDEFFQTLPIKGWTVRTDSRGNFFIQFPIDRSFTDGEYVVSANPSTGSSLEREAWFNDGDAFFNVYTPWRACKSGPLSNLQKGDYARLSAGAANNVRNHPRLAANKIGEIQAYQTVLILDGPKCNDGFTWWYVQVSDEYSENGGLEGWTAEGNASGYWLVPGY